MRARAAAPRPPAATGRRTTTVAGAPQPLPATAGRPRHGDLLRLQRSAGNRAVAQLLEQPATTPGGPAGAPPTFPIYDRTSRQKKMVDAAAYEDERARLGRLLRYLVKAIQDDAKTVLKEYPFTAVEEMYAESMDLWHRAAEYLREGRPPRGRNVGS